MTRADALATVRALARGLHPDVAGVDRLLERVAQHDAPETLRAALLERGAEAILDAPEAAEIGAVRT